MTDDEKPPPKAGAASSRRTSRLLKSRTVIGENMIFDRQQLEAFAAIVEMRHFGHAASELNITRGAVSQRLKSLEEALGAPLVVRDGEIFWLP